MWFIRFLFAVLADSCLQSGRFSRFRFSRVWFSRFLFLVLADSGLAEYGLADSGLAVSWFGRFRFSSFLYSRFRFGRVRFSKVSASSSSSNFKKSSLTLDSSLDKICWVGHYVSKELHILYYLIHHQTSALSLSFVLLHSNRASFPLLLPLPPSWFGICPRSFVGLQFVGGRCSQFHKYLSRPWHLAPLYCDPREPC